MNAAKHTPGPWFRDQYGHVYGWEPLEHGKRSVVLIDNRHSDATSADKNLISAAPDMLEALEELLSAPQLQGNDIGGSLLLRIAKDRSAIAKATGGEV